LGALYLQPLFHNVIFDVYFYDQCIVICLSVSSFKAMYVSYVSIHCGYCVGGIAT
jgi:hypothetical protein